MNLFAIAALTLVLTCLGLGFLVFRFGHEKLHWIWGYFNIVVATWGFGCFIAGTTSDQNMAIFGWKIAFFYALSGIVLGVVAGLILGKMNLEKEVVLKIQENKKIKFACIFGSYAKGLENGKSDVDLYIESEDSEIKKDYSKLDSKFSIKLGKWDKENLLIKEIIENHILIKGGEIYYERVFG